MRTERNVLTELEAREVFGHLTPKFLEVIQDSFELVQKWISSESENGYKRSIPVVNANLMHFYMVNMIFNEFKDKEYKDLKPVLYNRVFGLSYKDLAFIRIKKLNENFMPCKGHTEQAEALTAQLETKLFPSEPCIITLGYVCNKIWTELESVNFLCITRKEPLWNIHLDKEIIPALELGFPNFEENLSYSVEELLKTKKKA